MSEPARTPFVASLPQAQVLAQLPGSEVAWLDTARRENLAAFAQAGMPGTRVEAGQ